jgi:hypothetical protein
MSDTGKDAGDEKDEKGGAPDDERSGSEAPKEPRGRAQFTPAEQQRIRAQFTAGEPAICPQCDVPMTQRKIGGGSFGLGYARQREWLICPSCHRSAIFDVRRGTRN